MLRVQQPVPQLVTQTSSRSLLTAQKPIFTKSPSSRNLQPASPTLSLTIPKTRNTPASPAQKEADAPIEKKQIYRPEIDLQKDRIVITKLNKDSEIEFGILSPQTKALKPLEPFFRAITKDNNQSNLKISPKNALLYREDGVGLLLSKFQKPTNDQSNHSVDVKRNDIDDFCEDKGRVPKIMRKKSSHRRKSCVCTWCGGASALEKSIQNHPAIPATICHRHHNHHHSRHHLDESTGKFTLELLHTPTSESSRQSGWRLKVSNILPSRTSKKSGYGNFLQTSIVSSEVTPRNSVRSSQTMKLSFSEIKKDSVTLETPLLSACKVPRSSKMSRSSIQVEEEAGSQPSLNLEEDSPAMPSPKPTLTLLNRRKQIAPLALRNVPNIYDFISKGTLSEIKETERVSASDNTNKGLEANRKTEGNIFKVKRIKTKRNKRQLSLASTVQTIKELYASTCTTPKAERNSPKAQSHRDNANGLLSRKKKVASSSVSWGFEIPKAPVTATATLEKLSPKDVSQKAEPSSKEGSATFRKTTDKLKVDTQPNLSLRSVRTLQNLYKSQAGKVINSPKGKTTARKDCGPVVSRTDKYLFTA